MLASEPLDVAATLLNDTAKQLYTYTVMVPFIKVALRDLQGELEDNGIPRTKKRAASIVVTASATPTVLPTQPTDMVQPITLWEKAASESDDFYTEIHPRAWTPLDKPSNRLNWYTWQSEVISFLGCTVNRTVLLDYYQTLAEITDQTSTLLINNASNYLAFRTAYLIAKSIGGSAMAGRVAGLRDETEYALDRYIAVRVKGQQGLPVRCIGYEE